MKHFFSFFLLCSFLILTVANAESIADNWHQFRGPENNGVSRTATPPLNWSEKGNLRWKARLDGAGVSSPIIWGEKVFLLTARNTGKVDPSLPKPEDQPERVFGIKHPNTSYEMVVLCFDRNTGKTLWRKVAKTKIPHEGHHRDASFASATPFCDGKRLYCWFGSAGLFAYSLDGKKLWERDLGKARVGASLGEGSSPVVHDGKLILVRDFDRGQSSIVVLDAANGKTLWKKDREERNAWATPAIAEYDGVTQVITTATNQVRSYNLENGELIWWAKGLTNNCTPCPIAENGVVYCMSGYKGFSLLAIPISGRGDVTDSILWKADRGTPYVPSPILYQGQLYYTQSNQNILSSRVAIDGTEKIARTRIPELGGVYASPVGADGKIYFTGRYGTTVVIEAGSEFKILATNRLDDQFHASPALSGKQIILRGMRYLYCLEDRFKGDATVLPNPRAETPVVALATTSPKDQELRKLLQKIAQRPVPEDYPGGKGHQPFVDAWFASAPTEKASKVGRLWKEQRRLFPNMKNRGQSFIRILDYVRSEGK